MRRAGKMKGAEKMCRAEGKNKSERQRGNKTGAGGERQRRDERNQGRRMWKEWVERIRREVVAGDGEYR